MRAQLKPIDARPDLARPSRTTAVLVPLLAALLGAFLYHRYSLLTGLDRVQADTGDSRFVAFLFEHWRNALHGQADWRSPPIFWPLQGTLGYSELLVGMGVVHTLLRSFLGVFAAINLQLILLSLATFATAYLLFRRGFLLSVWAATAAAYFVAYSWPRFAQLVHLQLQFTPLLPLLALFALECIRDGMRLARAAFAWRAAAFVVSLALLLATTLYFAIFFALGLTVALLLCLLHAPARAHLGAVLRRHAWTLLGVALLGVVLVAPIAAVYWPVLKASSGRQWPEALSFLPRPPNLFWMGRENLVWGWLFGRWPEAVIIARWPEFRIGVGLVASLAWAGALLWAATRLRRPQRLDRFAGSIVVMIITGLILQLLMIRLPGDRSLWWFVWKVFPGANGIRAVSRLQLVVTLPMGLGVGVLIDRALQAARRRAAWRVSTTALVLIAAAEQFGSVAGYSGRGAEALSRQVGDAIPAGCRAAFILAPPDMRAASAPVDEAHFDARAYLEANPDVAAAWGGTAWEHYDRYGRAENRALTPAVTVNRYLTMFFAYNYTIPLAAALRGVPVVNGLSGWQPSGWDLFDVLSPATPQHLASWLQQNHVSPAEMCVVPERLTLSMLPDLPPGMWP